MSQMTNQIRVSEAACKSTPVPSLHPTTAIAAVSVVHALPVNVSNWPDTVRCSTREVRPPSISLRRAEVDPVAAA